MRKTLFVVAVASISIGTLVSGAKAVTITPPGDMQAAADNSNLVHNIRWVCRYRGRCFWVSSGAYRSYGYRPFYGSYGYRSYYRRNCLPEYASRPELCY